MAEKKYIEREALLERIDDIWDCADMVFEPNDHCCHDGDCEGCKWAETKNAIRKIIANFPAADMRSVVRGKWIRGDYWSEGCGMGESYGFYYKCSVCKDEVQGGYKDCGMKYCPNCGADMREER